jgi:hypothetical protein
VDEKFEKMKSSCAKGLKEFALVNAAKVGKFGFYYTCRIVIHQAIEHVFKQQNIKEHSAYIICNRFRSDVGSGKKSG